VRKHGRSVGRVGATVRSRAWGGGGGVSAQAAGNTLALAYWQDPRRLVADDDTARVTTRMLSNISSATEERRTSLGAQSLLGEWLRRPESVARSRERAANRVRDLRRARRGKPCRTEQANERGLPANTSEKRTVDTERRLTPQRSGLLVFGAFGRFAADGSTNLEIAAQMFERGHGEYHLERVFRKDRCHIAPPAEVVVAVIEH